MTQLLSAPSDIASWDWYVDVEGGEVLNSTTSLALSISRVLDRQSLMDLSEIRVSWHLHGQGPIGFRSLISLRDIQELNAEVMAERIMSSRPAGYSDTHAGQIELLGAGYLINANGERRREEQLVDVSLLVTPDCISVALGVRHDIWMWFDFSGRSHEKIYNSNKPRLSEPLKEISEVLKTETTPRRSYLFCHTRRRWYSNPGRLPERTWTRRNTCCDGDCSGPWDELIGSTAAQVSAPMSR